MQIEPRPQSSTAEVRAATRGATDEARVRGLEVTLRRRDAVLSAVCYAASRFLGTAEWDRDVQEMLGRLGTRKQILFHAGGAKLIELLRTPAFTAWGVPTSWAELFGFISGAACVWLVARQNIWNWPIGLLNNALFLVLFITAKLYADAALQVVFAVLGIYGWYRWLSPSEQRGAVIRRTTAREWTVLAACGVVGVGAATFWLSTSTDSPVPFWDSAVLVLSLLATYGQANKLLESWWLWIAVDIISVPLYVSRSLHLTAILYAGFLVLCLMGLRNWSRDFSARVVEQPA